MIHPEAMRVTWQGQRVGLYESFMDVTMDSLVTRNTINTHMHNIRKKICKVDPDFSCIKSEYGYDYRWVPEP